MANLLPGQVVIQPWSSSEGKYVSYTDEPAAVRGYVGCDGDTVFNTLARIAVERAAVSDKFVHLRFTHSNRYWARRGPGPQDHFIIASTNQPEEDTSKLSCTLFEPTLGDEGRLFLTHVQSGGRVRVDLEPGRVYVEDRNLRDSTELYTFRFVDWDTLVKMPRAVSFKGDNGVFLRAAFIPGQLIPLSHYVQFSSEDGSDVAAAFEVDYTHDGHVKIISLYKSPLPSAGQNWAFTGTGWINALFIDIQGSRDITRFWPVKVDDRTIALRSPINNKFCRRLTVQPDFIECLNASAPNIIAQAKLVVSERVLERSIYNVKYRMEDARIYDERPYVAGIGVSDNESDLAATLVITLTYSVTNTSSFSNTISIMAGVKTEMKAGIPFLAEGKIEVSAEVTDSLEWGNTTEETITAEAAYTVTVPGKSRARVNFVATRGNCNLPFSYTQRDKSSFDGQFVKSSPTNTSYPTTSQYKHTFLLSFEHVRPATSQHKHTLRKLVRYIWQTEKEILVRSGPLSRQLLATL